MKILSTLLMALILSACGGGGNTSGDGTPSPIAHTVQGHFVLRVEGQGADYVALEEALTRYQVGPPSTAINRRIRTAQGDVYLPPDGWSLIDMARHPSGALSVVLATQRALRLVRLDAQTHVVSDTLLADDRAPHDPYYDAGGTRDETSLLPLHTRDTVRLAALGEDLAVALRTGRHAVVAYRYTYTAAGGYLPRWRSLVEPGTTVMARHLISGTYDTYSQLINHFQVLLATNAQGDLAVAVPAAPHNGAFAAHAAHFAAPWPKGEALPVSGAIVTRLSGQGERLGVTWVDTQGPSQMYALRALPESEGSSGGWALAGRHKKPEGGWHGFAAWLDTAGSLQRQASVRGGEDPQRETVLFDIAALPDGRYLVAGATGYQQNPVGASISDTAAPLLAVLENDGRIARNLPLAAPQGQNPVYALEGQGTRWLVAGMRGGPGTHAADSDLAKLRADGYVLEIDVTDSAVPLLAAHR